MVMGLVGSLVSTYKIPEEVALHYTTKATPEQSKKVLRLWIHTGEFSGLVGKCEVYVDTT